MRLRSAVIFCAVIVSAYSGAAAMAQDSAMTPALLSRSLAAKPEGENAEKLADQVRVWFGKDNIINKPGIKVDEREVAWAIEVPSVSNAPAVVSASGRFRQPLQRIGGTNVYAFATKLENGDAMQWAYEVDGKKIGGGNLEVYDTPEEMKEQSGVPKGKLTQMPKWESKVFPGTTRDWWVYVPAQYKAEEPATVMVFQDGGGAKNYTPTCLDNMIAKGELPVIVAIFINPGTLTAGGSNRSFEYDTLSVQYSRFLLEEILPEVEKTVKLRHDPQSRAIAGISSGGICAWTVAWERPNEFSKVLSWVGSFTNIASGQSRREGGHNYPALIRKTPKKSIRAFLQDGDNDLDNAHGNWPLANQQMAKALAFAGYDYKFVYGRGFHSDKHGRAIMPESLRWLWRKE